MLKYFADTSVSNVNEIILEHVQSSTFQVLTISLSFGHVHEDVWKKMSNMEATTPELHVVLQIWRALKLYIVLKSQFYHINQTIHFPFTQISEIDEQF